MTKQRHRRWPSYLNCRLNPLPQRAVREHLSGWAPTTLYRYLSVKLCNSHYGDWLPQHLRVTWLELSPNGHFLQTVVNTWWGAT